MSAGPRWLRTLVLALAACSVLAAVPAHLLPVLRGTGDLGGSLATSGLLFTLVGGLVLLRQPEHRLGPLLVVIGACGTFGGLSEAVTTVTYGTGQLVVPGAVWAAWFGEWYWILLLWAQLVALPLLFPDGRLPSPRWRWFLRAALVLAVVEVVVALGAQELVVDGVQLGEAAQSRAVRLPNPVGFLPVTNFEDDLSFLLPLTAVFVLGALGSLAARYRRAEAVERRQLKVAVAGVAANALGFVVFGVLDALFGIQEDVHLLEFVLFLIIPVTLGVAILRYRLYDIDRLVSRTVTWSVTSVLLLGLYLGGVVALQATLRPLLGNGDLPVALATLAAAAAARPLLGRVQAAVDRRFNRGHYDAVQTIDTYARALRDEVALPVVVDGLRLTAREALQPAHVGIVLLSGGNGRANVP